MKSLQADTSSCSGSSTTPGTSASKVKVILGPNSSPETMGVHPFIGGAFKLPYLSWAATSGALSNKDKFKYLFRIVAPDSVTMKRQAGFINWLGFSSFNVVFIDDNALSSGQASTLATEAKVKYEMDV